MRVVVPAPEPAVCGHGGHEGRAGQRDPAQLAHAGHVVVQMLQHVERKDQVEARVAERQLLHRRPVDVVEAAPAAELDGALRWLDPRQVPEGGELDEVATCAATGVQHAGRPRRRGVAKQRPDHGAAAAEPPMAVLHRVELVVDQLVHLRRTYRTLRPALYLALEMAGRILVGTSSWADPGFVEDWYPKGMAARDRLEWYAQRFEFVEV